MVQLHSETTRFALALGVFVAVALFLTFNVISLPTLVIGDNFHWTANNIEDIIGVKVVRECYLGDIAVLSNFKSGFLYPLTYGLVAANLPSTIVYPFLFYVLSMVSFYFFSKEFIKNQALRILAATLYLINPITPYYYASIINAFSLVLLPIGLKFFVRALRELSSQKQPSVIKNLCFSGLFLALTVSANEQIILSLALVTVFLVLTFVMASYSKYRLTRNWLKVSLVNLPLFGLMFLVVLMPLIISLSNIQSAPLATYFQGPDASNFFQMIHYTYKNADLSTLLRLGGDSGTGLGNNAWYDAASFTNYFGYVLFGFFLLSIVCLAFSKTKLRGDRLFFLQSILLCVTVLALILLMKNLASASTANETLSLILKTWESPAKLRALLLISILTTLLVLFGMMDFSARERKRKVIVGLAVTLLIGSTMVYNSPWLINYAGKTTLQEVADSTQWGALYNQTYVDAASKLAQQTQGGRGIMLPFTHKAELYSAPNTRIFQLVSSVNDRSSQLFSGGNVTWSKCLGLFSVNSLVVMNGFDPNEGLIFPKSVTYGTDYTLEQIRNDSDLQLVEKADNFSVFNNPNALPLLYASNNYVIYDDPGTLKYAFDFVNFTDLPVFLNQKIAVSELYVSAAISQGNYVLHALQLPDNNTDSITLNVANGDKTRSVELHKSGSGELTDFSAAYALSPGDTITVKTLQPPQTRQLNDEILNSTAYPLGAYGSFSFDFTVNMLQNGSFSFLCPRVLLDTGNEVYYIILHDNGYVELAVQRGDVFYSAFMYKYVGYSLLDPSNSINVSIKRLIDEVNVYVDDQLTLTFPVSPKLAEVTLVSEQSTSLFSKMTLTTSDPVRLFAVRQDYSKVNFEVEQDSAESSAIKVTSNAGDFAVVSQYLYNDLKNVQSDLPSSSFRANIFFKGWIFNPPDAVSDQKITIYTQGQELSYSVTLLSIGFTYFMLLYIIYPSSLSRPYNALKRRIKGKRND